MAEHGRLKMLKPENGQPNAHGNAAHNGGNRAPHTHPAEGTDPALSAALSYIRALSSGVRRVNTAQGRNSRPQLLDAMLTEVHSLRDLCTTNGWYVPAMLALALGRIIGSLKDDASRLNVSNTRTCAKAVDFLSSLFSAKAHVKLRDRLPLTVMVIDDDAVSRRAMLLALNVEGLKVIACCCGEEALEKLRESQVDLIFSDIMMPRINGFDLLRLIRDLPNHQKTPVVFVTALSDFQTKARSVATGGCDFIAKPILPTEIVLKAFTFGLATVLTEETLEPNEQVQMISPAKPAPPARAAKTMGVVTINENGAIVSINKDGSCLFGYEDGELVGANAEKVLPLDLQTPQGRDLLSALRGRRDGLQLGPTLLVTRCKDGETRPASCRLSQSSRQGGYSSVLLVTPESDSGHARREAVEAPVVSRSASMAPIDDDSSRSEELLREEVARMRSIVTALERKQESLEAKLREEKSRNEQLERHVSQTPAMPVHSEALQDFGNVAEGLSSLRNEMRSCFENIQTHLKSGRGSAGVCESGCGSHSANGKTRSVPAYEAVQRLAHDLHTDPAGGVAKSAELSELSRVESELRREKQFNQNRLMIESLLCDRIRALESDLAS